MIESEAIVFKTLYVWLAAYNCSHISNFLEFLDLCFSSTS